MLNLNDAPYLGLHGNRTATYNFNLPSYVSTITGNPASTIIKKCTLCPEKVADFMKSNGFTYVSSNRYSTLDDTISEDEFLQHLTTENRKDYIVDSSGSDVYKTNIASSGSELKHPTEVYIQFILREYSIKTDDGHKLITEIDSMEISFTQQEQIGECEKIAKSILKSCYKRANQFVDEDSAIVGIIGSSPEGMYVKEYNLGKGTKAPTKKELDLHYGTGFSDFHEKLGSLLKSDSKGLIIFHGEPGTGKTYYIRMLLKDLVKSKKNVLYVPSNFIDSFLDPSFITFLSDWILEQNNPTIILLEDAECLVESRGTGVRSLGISNLLNITDGILNDILGTQIILTFNTDLDYIDSALLRPERLIARKEFSCLDPEESNLLLDHLGIDHATSEKMSLADIYSLKNKRSVLYHNIREKKSKVGFI